jgi:hypothetical protein
MNSSQLARRLGVLPDGPGGWAEYDRFINDEVRPLLARVGAVKRGETQQSHWKISEAQGQQVAAILGRPLAREGDDASPPER